MRPDRDAAPPVVMWVATLTWLLVFQLAGEIAVRWLALPVPGPVAGMVLLFVVLVFRGGAPEHVRTGSTALLQHLMLLLVPASAAVTMHAGRLGDDWLPIVLGGIGGAAVTMAVTAVTLRLLLSRGRSGPP